MGIAGGWGGAEAGVSCLRRVAGRSGAAGRRAVAAEAALSGCTVNSAPHAVYRVMCSREPARACQLDAGMTIVQASFMKGLPGRPPTTR